MAGQPLKNGSLFDTPLAYDIAAPTGRILFHRTGAAGTEFVPLWASAGARLTIFARGYHDGGTLTAALYSRRAFVSLRLPAGTLQADW